MILKLVAVIGYPSPSIENVRESVQNCIKDEQIEV